MSKYWQKRFEILEERRNNVAKQTIESIAPAFEQAQAQIEKEINAWYGRFAKNNEISLVEAKKLLNSRELKEFRWDVEEYIKYGRQNALNQAWMKQLENASARFHISRLEALKIRCQNAAERAFGNELDRIDEMAAQLYTFDYYHTAYEIQKGLGIGWDVGQIDERKLDNILSKPWTADKQTFSDRIWKSKTQLLDSLHTELTQMCILGKAPDQAIKNIANRMNVSKGQAGRLVMTEAAYFGSVAQKDCFNDLGVEKYEIVATLDSHTSPICQEMDGKVFGMKDFQAGVTAPPFHCWCRSCTAPYFEDEDGVGERYARDVETGEGYMLPKDTTYQQWKAMQDEKYGAGTVDKKRKMWYNESADKSQYENYKARLGDEAPKSFKDFQQIKYDNPEQYEDLCGQYAYRGRVPEATPSDYKAYKAVKATGIVGSVRVPPKSIDASALTFNDAHATRHGCTLEQAIGYVSNAKCSVTRKRWDGYHTGYYSVDGATYVADETQKIKTAFSKKDFDPIIKAVMEVFE